MVRFPPPPPLPPPSQQHRFSYNEPMPLESVTQSLCDLALRFGEDSDEGNGGGLVGVQGRAARDRLGLGRASLVGGA